MPTTTDNDLHALNVRCAALLGDDLTVHDFGPINFSKDKENCRLWGAVDRWFKMDLPLRIVESAPGYADYASWFWNNRNGQPWQADIEAHVRAYRADPPNYAGDIVLAMGLLDQFENYTLLRCGDLYTCEIRNLPDDPDEWARKLGAARGKDLAEAIARAFVAAYGEVRGDG